MTVRSWIRRGLERLLRTYNYRLVRPDSQFGIDAIVDVTRLSRLWTIDMAVVFDVGANIGSSSLAFRVAWPACTVVAFEPNEAVAQQLLANVAAVGGVSVERLALAAENKQSDFFICEDATVLSSLKSTTPFAERFGMQSKTVRVTLTTLDDYCVEHAIERINLLKIDAEGSDHDVLIGSRRMLAEKRIDFVYCEFNSLDPTPAQFGSLLPIAALLEERGYHFIASYNDYILTQGPFFATSNALFAAGERGVS